MFKEHRPVEEKRTSKPAVSPRATQGEKPDPFYKNRPTTKALPTKTPPPPITMRPAWMASAVVDPKWLEQYEKDHGEPKPTTDPLDLQWSAQKAHLSWCFDPSLFKNGKGVVTWRPDPKRSSHDVPAQTVQEAVREFMHSMYEIIEAKQPKQGDLEAVMWEEIPTLMRKLLQAAEDALSNAHDDLDETVFVRGVFERWIRDNETYSDISGEELIRTGLDNIGQSDLDYVLSDLRLSGKL